jgi:PAS domain S-box-containing protein
LSADPSSSRTRALTVGRSFLLWLLGVLVVTLVLVSALVLWHEQRILEAELLSRAQLLAHVLGVAAVDGSSAEYDAIVPASDVRAGEVRDADGRVLWAFGLSPAELDGLDSGLLRIERRVEVDDATVGGPRVVDVVLLVSQSRVRSHLAAAAVRLLAGLGLALALALVVGLALVGGVVKPLHQLAGWAATFDPERAVEPPVAPGAPAEVGDLAAAFRDMALRLADQRSSLVASEQRFRELFSASPTPLIRLDGRLRIRDANPAAEPFLHGRTARATGNALAGYLDRPDSDHIEQALTSLSGGNEAIIEAHWRIDADSVAEVELRVAGASDDRGPGYLVAIHDLTDRLRRMGEHWRRTFDAMVDGVALVDDEGRITLANRALAPHEAAVANGLEAQLREGAPTRWRVDHVGRLLDCTLSRPEGLGHAILVVRDVTEAVDAEERLRAAEKMQAVGTLASGVAHDFNNLLAGILLHVRLLQRQPDALADAASAIRVLAEEGSEVVRELLFFARRESSPPTTFDLGELVRQQESVLTHLLSDTIELILEIDREPVPVRGDVVGLRRLLLNLVLNARDAVGEAGGRIVVRVEHAVGRAVLEVEDDGPGIPPEIRERLFEPFFTLRRQGRGSGLGLAVVYSIVTAHGGEVDVRSRPGEPTRLIVRLPLGEASRLESVEGRRLAPVALPRVLLVDSDGRAASRVVEALAEAGLEIRHASTVGLADEMIRKWPAQVVVLSGRHEVGDAGARLRALRLPVVVLTDEDEDAVGSWGPRVVRLRSTTGPDAILAALRNLGIITNS